MRRSWLSILLPTAEETDLLRACVWSGAAAGDAWSRWQGGAERLVPPPDAATKGLLPLLHRAMRHNGIAVEPPARAALGAAALAEERRYAVYRDTCALALDTLAGASIRCVVLKGAALAEVAYPEPALRHSHDIDLLVEATDLDRTAATLHRAGFTPSPVGPRGVTGTQRVIDPSGLPLELHDRLFRLPFYAPPLADVWAHARPCQIAARSAATLSVADHLAHVCGQAACSGSRDSLRWVVDAWYLIERGGGVDWDGLLRLVAAGRLAVPLAVQFEYLATDLGAAIPASVRNRLAADAKRADPSAWDVALVGVRAGARGTLRNLLGARAQRADRLDLLRRLLLPSPASLRRGAPLRHPRLWALEYVARPARFLARALRWQRP